jgi:type II secretory pathway component GspD/PulD (secretin)
MRFIRITALLALFSIPAFAEINVRDGKITANFTSQTIGQAVQTIKEQSGIQINVDESVANESVSANFKDLPLAAGIKKLLEGTGINYAVIAGSDGVPSAILISGSEKPGAPPKKLDTRPVAAAPVPARSVVTPVNPSPPPISNPSPQGGGAVPNAGMNKPVNGVAPVGAPNANQQPNAINPMLKFDPNNVPTAGSLVPTVNTPQMQPPLQPQPNAGTVVTNDDDDNDDE